MIARIAGPVRTDGSAMLGRQTDGRIAANRRSADCRPRKKLSCRPMSLRSSLGRQRRYSAGFVAAFSRFAFLCLLPFSERTEKTRTFLTRPGLGSEYPAILVRVAEIDGYTSFHESTAVYPSDEQRYAGTWRGLAVGSIDF